MASHTKINSDRALFKKAQRGDTAARNAIAVANVPLVRRVVGSFYCSGNGFDREDLFQVGFIGLMRAIKTFNPRLSAFSTYASKWIYSCVMHELRNGGVMHGPTNLTQNSLRRKLDAIPLDDHKQREPLRLKLVAGDRCASLDVPVRQEEGCLPTSWGELIEDPHPLPDELASDHERETAVKAAVEKLDDRRRTVIRRRARGTSLREIGDQFGVTRECIRQLEEQTGKRLAAKLEWLKE